MEELLYRYNPWWEGKYSPRDITARPLLLGLMEKQLTSRNVVLVTGLRRVGKTTLIKLFIKNLLEKQGIAPERILYISLDDYSFLKRSVSEIVEEYRKIHKISFAEKVFLFLDEVAYQKDFELQLKNLYDSQNVKIYASSSSSSILAGKKPYLTGRSAVIEVLPLDFQEYLEFKKIKIAKSDSHLIERYFEEYMRTGGLPEYVLRGDISYLKDLVDDIIYKDIAAVHNIKNPQVLKDFFVLLMERSGKVASINKMARILSISPDTAKRYLQMFAGTYLVYLVSRSGKTNERLLAPKKVYAADLGIRVLFTGFKEKGSLFENYVFLKIKDRNPCYVYTESTEIDFLTDDKTLIEVKYNSELTQKQTLLFRKIKAQKKFIIGNIGDLEKILS